MAMTFTVDIFSDIACPWCLIGKVRFDRALAATGLADEVEVRYHSFVLDPELPTRFDGSELEYLASRKGMAPAQVEQMLAQVTEVAAGEGLSYDFDRLVVASSLTAHRVLKAAEREGGGRLVAAVAEAFMRGHFEQGRDIGDEEALVEMATGAGMSEGVARAGVEDVALDAQVQADLRHARELGVDGVPFYVLAGRYGISGAQPAESFAQALRQVHQEVQTPRVEMIRPVGGGQACGPQGC